MKQHLVHKPMLRLYADREPGRPSRSSLLDLVRAR